MTGLWAVIRREFLERVRSRWFVLATVGAPVVLIGLMVLPALMASSSERAGRRIVVVDRTGVLYERLAPSLREGGLDVEAFRGGDLAELDAEAREGGIGGYLVLDETTLARGHARFVAGSSPSPLRRLSLRGAVVQAAMMALLADDAGRAEALLAGGDLEVEVLSPDAADLEEPEYMSVFLGTFLLYMVVL
ncbi:MAG TPA: hypothetical protein VLL48_02040, partial [Longimicrobiales bacterium]|nr:hypothetical protein [Longimicrobiales bacterium]